MRLSLRSVCVACGVFAWLAIGSTARVNIVFGLGLLTCFAALALIFGARTLARRDVALLMALLLFALWYCYNDSYDVVRTGMFMVEIACLFFILRRPGNLDPMLLAYLIAAYAAITLMIKVLSGYPVLSRDYFFLNGPIVFAMICGIGFVTILFSDRLARHASTRSRAVHALLLLLLLVGCVSSLSRSPLLFLVASTTWFFVRGAGMYQRLAISVIVAAGWSAIASTRLFYVNAVYGDSLPARILGGRLFVWTETLGMFDASLFLGGAMETFRRTNFADLEYPHNLFLETVLGTGYLGLLVFLAMLCYVVRRWTVLNLGIFVVSLASGNIFLWIKVFLVPAPSTVRRVAGSRARPPARLRTGSRLPTGSDLVRTRPRRRIESPDAMTLTPPSRPSSPS